jgi:hypothetical protein
MRASWALLLALNGFHYSAVGLALTLQPAGRTAAFRGFWTVPSGWGGFSLTEEADLEHTTIQPVEGILKLERLVLADKKKRVRGKVSARLGHEAVSFTKREEGRRLVIAFEPEIEITPKQPLTIERGA